MRQGCATSRKGVTALSKQECETIVSQVDAAIVPPTRYDYMRAAARYAAAPLEAQLEAARKDGERYLWLCEQDDSADIQVLRGISWTNVAACCALTFQGGKPEIDEAIDAALEATTPEKQG